LAVLTGWVCGGVSALYDHIPIFTSPSSLTIKEPWLLVALNVPWTCKVCDGVVVLMPTLPEY